MTLRMMASRLSSASSADRSSTVLLIVISSITLPPQAAQVGVALTVKAEAASAAVPSSGNQRRSNLDYFTHLVGGKSEPQVVDMRIVFCTISAVPGEKPMRSRISNTGTGVAANHSPLARSWPNCFPVRGPLPRRQCRRRAITRSHGGPNMLILSRRVGERIVIDSNITVTVVEIQTGKIRLGIETPKGIPVWRGACRLGHRDGIDGSLKARRMLPVENYSPSCSDRGGINAPANQSPIRPLRFQARPRTLPAHRPTRSCSTFWQQAYRAASAQGLCPRGPRQADLRPNMFGS